MESSRPFGSNLEILAELSDTETLFKKHTVNEIREFEKKILAEIEYKKQELRLTIGERYQDLIAAADTISSMKTCAMSLSEHFDAVEKASTIFSTKVEGLKNAPKDPEAAATEAHNQAVYAMAAQLKILMDTPEQIWHYLETHRYLKAARSFLLAKLVYKTLKASPDMSPLNVPVTLPIIQRQWDAVSHFRAQILAKATQNLSITKQSDKSLTETIAALIVLENITPLESLKRLLGARTDAIQGFTEQAIPESLKLPEHIGKIFSIFRSTIVQVASVFLLTNSSSSPPLQMQLNSLSHAVSPTTPITDNEDSFADYSVSAYDFIFQFLPSNVVNYTPYINDDGKLNKDSIKTLMMQWLSEISDVIMIGLKELLKAVHTGQAARDLRLKLITECEGVDSIALMRRRNVEADLQSVVSSEQSTWMQACEALLGKTICVYEEILRPVINARIMEIISESFNALSLQPETVIEPRVSTLRSEDINLGDHLWLQSGKINMEYAKSSDIRTITPAQHDILSSLEQSLENITKDLEGLISLSYLPQDDKISRRSSMQIDLSKVRGKSPMVLVPLSGNGTPLIGQTNPPDVYAEDWFLTREDALEFMKVFKDKCADAMNAYALGLQGLLRDFATEKEISVDQNLFIGQIAKSISTRSKNLPRIFANTYRDPPQNTSSALPSSKFRMPLSLRTAPKDYDIRYRTIQQTFHSVFLLSHEQWFEHLSTTFATLLTRQFQTTEWTSKIRFTDVWEEVLISLPSDEGVIDATEEKVKLPSRASRDLVEALFLVGKEVNRVFAFMIDKTALKLLLIRTMKRALSAFHAFVKGLGADISDKGAFQLFFDFLFLERVFEGAHLGADSADKEFLESLRMEIVGSIKSYIDPIDMVVFEPHILTNIDRFYHKTQLLLGPLTMLNPKSTSTKKSAIVQELHNVIPMVPQSPRFALLPIAMPAGITPAPLAQHASSSSGIPTESTASHTHITSHLPKPRPTINLMTKSSEHSWNTSISHSVQQPRPSQRPTAPLVSTSGTLISAEKLAMKASELLQPGSSFASGLSLLKDFTGIGGTAGGR